MPWQSHVVALITSHNLFRKGANIARRIELEYMIRLFSERQISIVLSSISRKLSDNRYVIVIRLSNQSRKYYKEDVISRIIDAVETIARNYKCRYLNWNELLRKPELHVIDALSIFKEFKNINASNIEKNLDEILIGVSGCSSILIE